MTVGIDVSVIIVNYNTYDLVVQCIDSVVKHTKNFTYEIIVVDNNSPNRDIENLNIIFPDINLILNDKNSGFGIANNIGNQFAKGDYIFLLNSDTILIDNSINELHLFMKENNEVGVCGGNLCDKNLMPATSFSRLMPSMMSDLDYLFFNIFTKLIYRKNIYYYHGDNPIEIKGNISGADLMISKKIFDSVGGFDENFFMYYEETDLLYRIRQKKYKTYIVPKSKIIHLEGASESVKSVKLDWTYDSKKKYYQKNRSNFSLLISDFIFYIIVLQRLLIFKLIGNKAKFTYWYSFYEWLKSK